ncbi:rRNA adenine N-6-methyltransferase family protein, partial [Bacteroidota bacterium]
MVRPKKHLGQHFLTDPSIAKRMVDLVPEDNHSRVVEIGPGKGILTDFLVPDHKEILLIEIDGESVEYLNQRYPQLQ